MTCRLSWTTVAGFTYAMGLLIGCAHGPGGWVGPLAEPSPPASPEVARAVEAFYTASTPDAMEEALATVHALAPESADYHDLKAQWARLHVDRDGEVNHLLAALGDPADIQARYHLYRLQAIADSSGLTFDETYQFEARTRQLAAVHPDHNLRSLAGVISADLQGRRGEFEGMRTMVRRHAPGLDFAVIGTFDNDQGKGFDTRFGPEDEQKSTASYDGKILPARWRTDLPKTRLEAYSLETLLHPTSWVTAYATAAIGVDREQAALLQLSSTSPFKLWLNGRLVAAIRLHEGQESHDQFVIPLRLKAGANRLLLKFAHRQAFWRFKARLTDEDGADLSIKPLPFDAKTLNDSEEPKPLTEPDMVRRVAPDDPIVARRRFTQAHLAHAAGLARTALPVVEEMLGRYPEALLFIEVRASLHWALQERGQVANLLGELTQKVDLGLPLLSLKQARFFRQQKRLEQARDILDRLLERLPDNAELQRHRSHYFKAEGWSRERCATLNAATRLEPGNVKLQIELAACHASLGQRTEALSRYQAIHDQLPGLIGPQNALRELAVQSGQTDRALGFVRRRIAHHRPDYYGHVLRGDIQRDAGRIHIARRAYRRALKLNPQHPRAHRRLGDLAYAQGNTPLAVQHWQQALSRQPDNNALSRRIAFHDEQPKEAWLLDVPSEAALLERISAKPNTAIPEGTEVLALLDSAVETVHADGSRTGVLSQVLLAVSDRGRDRITALSTGPPQHRSSILHAFSIHPDGTRFEASRPRDGKVRFPSLTTGSVVVLQIRYDAPPQPYLGGYISYGWFFNVPGVAAIDSHYTLWTSPDQKVHFHSNAGVQPILSQRAGRLRHHWMMRDVPPLIPEPAAPPLHELAYSIRVSTVPDWDAFIHWERALLSEAFRMSPEVEQLAKTLTADIASKAARFEALYRFVLEEIRYQQDYENTIAGVKPHTAPVVLERRYGDCKDKSVLLMVLARAAGIDAHFALVRTRRKGPVLKEVPHQQFDHAVVYLPEQPGIEVSRFVDPTAEGLDLSVLRPDVPGTLSLVYDPVTESHTWREVPFQPVEAHQMMMTLELEVGRDGSAKGVLRATGTGGQAAQLRKLAKNSAQADKAFRALAGKLLPTAQVEAIHYRQVTALNAPVLIELQLSFDEIFTFEGREGIFSIPWRNLGTFAQRTSLEVRQSPLVIGVPQMSGWTVDLRLPKGWKVLSDSSETRVSSSCSALTRTVEVAPRRVVAATVHRSTCERITPERYVDERRFSIQADELRDASLRIQRR